jgi:hypothetical protein
VSKKDKENHPSNNWVQQQLWSKQEDSYYRSKSNSMRKPYDQDKVVNHDIETLKTFMLAILNTLDEINGHINDQAEILDDIVYVLYKDEE